MKPTLRNKVAHLLFHSKVFVSIALLALVISSCSQPNQQPTSPPSASYFFRDPLTSLSHQSANAVDKKAISRPSVACKIDNSEAARPQLNLSRTDIVFDEMVEGGLTRLVAIWQSDLPDAVGPVRSIRPMDPDILSPFGGIVCYSGGQAVFTNAMKKTNVFNASETSEQGQGTFSRTKDREAPHNVIVNVQKLASNHPEIAPPSPQFQFSKDLATSTASSSGTTAAAVKVLFPSALAEWTASSDASVWMRTQDKKPHTDAANGKQLSAVNVVVLEAAIDRSYLDHKYGNVPRTVMVATGKAWVFAGGKYIEATWSKSDRTAPVALADQSGKPILLAPGNTWVELMPKSPEGKITISR